MSGKSTTVDFTPARVSALLHRSAIILIDVREPGEFAAERIHGALNFPLSTFDPANVPLSDDQLVVFQCGSGKRSAAAVKACLKAGLRTDAHLAGGIAAWKAQGLPTISLDVEDGAVRDRG
jgi:rhodanese-related sulfurtransferase